MTMVGCIWMVAAYTLGPMMRLSNGVEMLLFGIGTFNVLSNGRSCEVYTKEGEAWKLVTLAFTKKS